MIVEERTYHIIPNHLEEFLGNYESHGLAVQTRILGKLVGYFTTDVGEVNTVVHMWGYESLAERARRRAMLYKDAEWRAYLALNLRFVVNMHNRILVSTRFSPL